MLYDNQSFEEQCRIEQKTRQEQWYWQNHCNKARGIYIYTDFCVWCNCQGDTNHKLRRSAKAFANWLKNEKIVLTEYQRQCIATKYFGWEFYWNEKESKWESKKV